MRTLEDRVVALEATQRRYRCLVAAMALTVLATMLLAAGPKPVPDVIRAKRFEVMGQQGKPVVAVWGTERGGWVYLYNDQGRELVTLGGGTVAVLNAERRKLVRLTAAERGGVLEVADVEGRQRVALRAIRGAGAVAVRNAAGKIVGTVRGDGLGQDGSGAVVVRNQAGQIICSLRSDENGSGEIAAWSRDGKTRTLGPGS